MTATELANLILITGEKGYKNIDEGFRISHKMKLLIEEFAQSHHESQLVNMPSDEEIEINFPSEIGQSIIMEKDKTYEETRIANYNRRQGARWIKQQTPKK